MIEIHDLHKAYDLPGGGVAEVLRGIDLVVPDRCITAVVGPSGSGKTTLSRCISLLDRPTAGSILVNGTDLSHLTGEALRRQRRAIGTIFQSSALLGRKTAAENVALPLRYFGVTEAGIRQRVDELLDSVGLPDKAKHYPGQLSGGQRQRIGIARALALGPQVLLSDEATSGLDPQATESVLALLRQLRDQFSLSVIRITHEMDVVRRTADQVAVLRQGRIVERGSVGELVADPASATGGQLLPVMAPLSDDAGLLQLEVRYAADRPVPADWISRLCEALPVRVSLLGGSVEAAGGGTIGRLRLGVSWQHGSPPETEAVLHELSRFGLNAAVLREPAPSARPGVRLVSTRSITQDIVLSSDTPWTDLPSLMLPAYAQTWIMVGIVMVFVIAIGGAAGVTLFNSSPRGLLPHRRLNAALSWVVNMGRSLPFLVLMAAIIPFTRLLTGTTIGIPAAVVPMVVAGVPFFARLVETALRELPEEAIAVGLVSGGSALQIIGTVQLSEALPGLIAAVTLNMISMIEYSAIAGTIGAGGIGYLAVVYGYQRFDQHVMIATIVALVATIQLVQLLGDRLAAAARRA